MPSSGKKHKAMLSIFYGRRVLPQAKIVPDKKKKLTFKHFFIFSSDILKSWEVFPDDSQRVDFYFLFFSSDEGKKPLSGSVDHRIY